MLPTLLVKGKLQLYDENNEIYSEPDVVPIDYIVNWIKHRSSRFGSNTDTVKDRILLVNAETGSGKSTVMPSYIFRLFRNKISSENEKSQVRVICTQPRVLTAIDISVKLSMEEYNSDLILGNKGIIGYNTGPYSNAPKYGLMYASLGVLMAQLNKLDDSDFITYYDVIIIDEAHERDLDLDIILMSLKNLFIRNKTKKLPFVIITSATFDYNRYAKFFELPKSNIIKIIGHSYNKTIKWWNPKNPIDNYLLTATDLILKIHLKYKMEINNDILVFVSGVGDANKIKVILEEIALNRNYNYKVIFIDSLEIKSNTLQYNQINDDYIKDDILYRKIILSTNVAETGLTLDKLKYVIDCGYSKSSETYYPHNINGIILKPVTKNKVIQRMGRIGRKSDGYFFPLYDEKTYDNLIEYSLPDIINKGINDIYLKIVIEQQKNKLFTNKVADFNIDDIKLLDYPSIENIWLINSKAYLYGFLSYNTKLPTKYPFDLDSPLNNNYGYGITKNGIISSRFSRIGIEESALLFMAINEKINLLDIITIIAFKKITYDSIFEKSYHIADFNAVINLEKTFVTNNEIINEDNIDISDNNKLNSKSEKELEYVNIKLKYNSDFIIALLIFNKAISFINDNEKFLNWCNMCNIKLQTINQIITERIEIINDIINNNIDIYENYTELNVNKIKKCLYHAYKFNILTLNVKHDVYKNHYDLNVVCKEYIPKALLTKTKTKLDINKVLTNKIVLISQPTVNLYNITTDYISILEEDENFYETEPIDPIHI